MKIITVQVYSNHEPTIERFIRSMRASGWDFLQRRDRGLPMISFARSE